MAAKTPLMNKQMVKSRMNDFMITLWMISFPIQPFRLPQWGTPFVSASGVMRDANGATQIAPEHYGNVMKEPCVIFLFPFAAIDNTSASYFVFGWRKLGGTCRLVTEADTLSSILTPISEFVTITS